MISYPSNFKLGMNLVLKNCVKKKSNYRDIIQVIESTKNCRLDINLKDLTQSNNKCETKVQDKINKKIQSGNILEDLPQNISQSNLEKSKIEPQFKAKASFI